MSCMFSCCCCPPAPPRVISPKGEGKGSSYLCGVRAGRCHCLSRECPFLWPLKGTPGSREAGALPHTRSQSWPPGGLDCFEHKPLGGGDPSSHCRWERRERPPRDSVTGVPFGLLLCALQAKLWEGQDRDRGGAAGPTGHRLLSERPRPGAAPPALGSLGEMSPFQIRPWGHSLWLSWLNTSMHLPSVTENPLLVHHRTDLRTFSIASGYGH